MEPNLEDIDDYEKPISKNKLRTITITFVIVVILGAVLTYFINILSH